MNVIEENTDLMSEFAGRASQESDVYHSTRRLLINPHDVKPSWHFVRLTVYKHKYLHLEATVKFSLLYK